MTGTSPAPWAINSSGGAITIVSRDRSVLAVIVGGGDAAPFEAGNAALMAAAPALRDALRGMVDLLGRRGEMQEAPEMVRALDALAKAAS